MNRSTNARTARTARTARAARTADRLPPAARAAARHLLACGDVVGAAEAFDLIDRDDAARARRRYDFGIALAKRGRTDDAMQVWRGAVDRWLTVGDRRHAAAVCRRALCLRPTATDWSLRLARILISGGQLTEALSVLRSTPIPTGDFEARLMAGMIARIERRLATGPLSFAA